MVPICSGRRARRVCSLGPTGNVADSYTYSPYGVLLASTGTDANPFRYGGQAGYYTDTNNRTGAILCGLRWYDPALGRWLSRDPIGYSGGPNLYEYCGSNPVGNIDPFGMDDAAYGTTTFGQLFNPATWLDASRTSGAVLTDTFTGGLISSKSHANDPGYDGSAWSAWISREAITQIATAGLGKLLKSANLVQRAKVAKVLRGPLSMYKPGAFRCQITASAAANALEKAGIPFRKLLVQDAKQVLSAGGEVFSKTGYHEAVQVGDRVYDATTGVRGLPMNEWIRRGGLTSGQIQYQDFLETISHLK